MKIVARATVVLKVSGQYFDIGCRGFLRLASIACFQICELSRIFLDECADPRVNVSAFESRRFTGRTTIECFARAARTPGSISSVELSAMSPNASPVHGSILGKVVLSSAAHQVPSTKLLPFISARIQCSARHPTRHAGGNDCDNT